MSQSKVHPLLTIVLLFFVPAISSFLLFRMLNLEFVEVTNLENNFGMFSNFISILLHNQLVLLIIYSGILTFKIPTIINLIANGFSFGFHYAGIYVYGLKTLSILLHAIPELLAFFTGAYIVFKGLSHFKGKPKKLIMCILLAEGFLIIAAWTENYITPMFI